MEPPIVSLVEDLLAKKQRVMLFCGTTNNMNAALQDGFRIDKFKRREDATAVAYIGYVGAGRYPGERTVHMWHEDLECYTLMNVQGAWLMHRQDCDFA